MPHEFITVNKKNPCPICKHDSWCGVRDDGVITVCMRMETEKPAKNGGWVHVMAEPRRPAPPRMPSMPQTEDKDFEFLMRKWTAMTNEANYNELASKLGVTPESIVHLGAAWSWTNQAWAFPMRNAAGITVGIRLRDMEGKKLAVKGSKAGVMHGHLEGDGPLLVCEGPTDTAAALTLGFRAVGRPSCLGCEDEVQEAAKRAKARLAVIVADRDGPGVKGARTLAAIMKTPTKIIMPQGKDMREWLRKGATKNAVEAVIKAARIFTPSRASV